MSTILATGEAISRSCTNTSKTKQMYSFSKAPRFPEPFVNTKIPEEKRKQDIYKFYDIPSTLVTRKTKFDGKASRYDFTKVAKNNKSEFVVLRSDFDKDHPHGPKYSFGVGRDKFGKVYIESNKMFDKDVPGPGKYYNHPQFGKEAIAYSFRGTPEPKKEVIDKIHEKMKAKYPSPGPGEYPICVKINPTGKYVVSNIQNVSSLTIKPSQNKNQDGRFSYISIFIFMFICR